MTVKIHGVGQQLTEKQHGILERYVETLESRERTGVISIPPKMGAWLGGAGTATYEGMTHILVGLRPSPRDVAAAHSWKNEFATGTRRFNELETWITRGLIECGDKPTVAAEKSKVAAILLYDRYPELSHFASKSLKEDL